MKKLQCGVILAMALMMAACTTNISPDTYSVDSVGDVTRSVPGVVISARPVNVEGTQKIGGLTGAVAGGVAGSAIGGNDRMHALGAIGGAVTDVLENMQFSADDVKIAFADLDFYPSQLREIPAHADAVANAEKAKREYDELIANNAPYSICRSAECTLIGANQLVKHAFEAEKYGKEAWLANGLPVRMRAVRVGDWAVFAVSAEMFVEIGLAIKEASPFKTTFVSTVSMGTTIGYICSDYAYDQYCYEPQSSMFCRGIAGEISEAAGKLLQSLA